MVLASALHATIEDKRIVRDNVPDVSGMYLLFCLKGIAIQHRHTANQITPQITLMKIKLFNLIDIKLAMH